MNNYKEIVGFGDYEHNKPLTIDDMVLGDTYKIINPQSDLESGFFEFVQQAATTDLKGYFLPDSSFDEYYLCYADMKPAPRTVSIDGVDCKVTKVMYEDLMRLKSNPPAAK